MHAREAQIRNKDKLGKPLIYTASKLGLGPELCDSTALWVVRKLEAAQFETYIVGGVVRDLLSGREPKDFDVATAAHPEQVRNVFGRSSRIIGRRFRLAHVFYNRKVVEVATFRGKAKRPGKAGIAATENTFGNLEEDMDRRDFTVNAMYYGPFSDRLICHENAIADLEATQLRTIGNAAERFTEDPVRMLRAVRFVSRLNFGMVTGEVSTIKRQAEKLHSASRHRLWTECQKLFLSGSSLAAFETLKDFGLFGVLFPQTHKLLIEGQGTNPYNYFMQKLFADTDSRIKEGCRATLYFVFLGFLWLEIKHRLKRTRKLPLEILVHTIKRFLMKQNETVTLSKQVAWTIEKICLLAWQMENRQESYERTLLKSKHLSFKPAHIRAARDLLSLSVLSGMSTKSTVPRRLSGHAQKREISRTPGTFA